MKGRDVLPESEVPMTPEMAHEMRGRLNLPVGFKAQWKGSQKGRCAILANGPSLPSAEELGRIDCPVVGVNRSFLRRASDFHVVVDKMHVGAYGHLLHKVTPHAVLRLTRYAARGCVTPMRLAYHRVKAAGRPMLPDLADDGWVTIGAGMAALQVAVWVGFDEIIFCGLDLRRAREHFYPEPEWMRSHLECCHASVLEAQVEYLRLVRPELDELGVRVISTTMNAGEHTLTKIRFDAIWPPAE